MNDKITLIYEYIDKISNENWDWDIDDNKNKNKNENEDFTEMNKKLLDKIEYLKKDKASFFKNLSNEDRIKILKKEIEKITELLQTQTKSKLLSQSRTQSRTRTQSQSRTQSQLNENKTNSISEKIKKLDEQLNKKIDKLREYYKKIIIKEYKISKKYFKLYEQKHKTKTLSNNEYIYVEKELNPYIKDLVKEFQNINNNNNNDNNNNNNNDNINNNTKIDYYELFKKFKKYHEILILYKEYIEMLKKDLNENKKKLLDLEI